MAAAASSVTVTATATADALAPLQQFRAVVVCRVSSGGYAKTKPEYITKLACFVDTLRALELRASAAVRPTLLYLIADKCTDELFVRLSLALRTMAPRSDFLAIVERTDFGNGAASFRHGVERVLGDARIDPDALVYMLEDDYLHARRDVLEALAEGLTIGDYATGYDHPDKYGANAYFVDGHGPSAASAALREVPAEALVARTRLAKLGAANPFVEKTRADRATGSERGTSVWLSRAGHWKRTNSTTMTFATRLRTLREDYPLMAPFVAGTHPHDFHLWLTLAHVNRRLLVSAVPAFSTHGETEFLSPCVDWAKVAAPSAFHAERIESVLKSASSASTAVADTTAAAAEPGSAATTTSSDTSSVTSVTDSIADDAASVAAAMAAATAVGVVSSEVTTVRGVVDESPPSVKRDDEDAPFTMVDIVRDAIVLTDGTRA